MFHNSNLFGSCIIHILDTGCAKIKKNNSGAKRLANFITSLAAETPEDEGTTILPIIGTTHPKTQRRMPQDFNLSAPELFFLILAHRVYKM